MIKQLTFILLLSISTKIFAQEKQIVISGNIINDALSVENIHILNKTSNKGTIANKYGEFKIPIKANDTLIFSGIQFYKKEVLITQQINYPEAESSRY